MAAAFGTGQVWTKTKDAAVNKAIKARLVELLADGLQASRMSRCPRTPLWATPLHAAAYCLVFLFYQVTHAGS